MFWFFGQEARGILAPRPGIEPAPPALEGEVLTGPPGKYHKDHFWVRDLGRLHGGGEVWSRDLENR